MCGGQYIGVLGFAGPLTGDHSGLSIAVSLIGLQSDRISDWCLRSHFFRGLLPWSRLKEWDVLRVSAGGIDVFLNVGPNRRGVLWWGRIFYNVGSICPGVDWWDFSDPPSVVSARGKVFL